MTENVRQNVLTRMKMSEGSHWAAKNVWLSGSGTPGPVRGSGLIVQIRVQISKIECNKVLELSADKEWVHLL